MPSFEPVRFGLIGSGWITGVHIKALRAIDAPIVALADYPRERTRSGRGEDLARRTAVPKYYASYRAMLEDPAIEAVTVALPNSLHAEVTLAALDAGKHVFVEKPLCFTLDEADRIVKLAREKKLVAGYAEELCYVPKLVRARELAQRGLLGRVFLAKQVESHAGPYSEWFFDPELSGGGALIDMGCHSIEWARFIFDKAPVAKVTATIKKLASPERKVDDFCSVTMEYADGRVAICEAGWTRKGGMISRAELQGSEGALDVDLLTDTGIRLFSERGSGEEEIYPGWSSLTAEWLYDNGYPQEFSDFARAIREGRAPRETAEDGRAVLEIMWAAYASAASGRTIELPYAPPKDAPYPAAMWIGR